MKKGSPTCSWEFGTRRRFANQVIKFWRKSKEKDERDSACADEEPGNTRLQGDQSEVHHEDIRDRRRSFGLSQIDLVREPDQDSVKIRRKRDGSHSLT